MIKKEFKFTDCEWSKLKKAKKEREAKVKTNYSWPRFFLILTRGISVKREGNKTYTGKKGVTKKNGKTSKI